MNTITKFLEGALRFLLILLLMLLFALAFQSYGNGNNQPTYFSDSVVVAANNPSVEPHWRILLSEYPALEKIAKCESGLNPLAYSHDGGAQARGLFQITRKYFPEITDEQAFDPLWSLNWSAKQNLKIWTCARILKLI